MTTPTRTDHLDLAAASPTVAPPAPPVGSRHRRRAPMALIVTGSGVAGFVAATALVAAPVVPATESALTGAVVCGFALGWAALVGLSARFTDQPQRWATVPAVLLGAGGIALLALGSSAHPVVDWVWPPVVFALALWLALRIRRDLTSRSARWLLYPVVSAMGVAAAGGGYQTVGSAVDSSSPVVMPGRLLDVGGHRLHLSCTGSGRPTVVVEAGGGEMAANLGWITTAVAHDTTICVYDRAGRGWSEDADAPQDAVAISTDLHSLLHRGGVPGPYVIAGHSFGGLYALTFAARHPEEVAGMVLIDSTAPHDGPAVTGKSPRSGAYDVLDRFAALTSSMARLGVGRLYATLAVVDLPPRERDEVRVSTATPGTLRSTIEEFGRANDSMQEAASLRDFGDKALVVLSAGVGSDADWPRKQQQLAALSTNSAHRVVDGASHEALVGDPVHAATTSQAIVEVVESVRTGQRLSR